NSTVFSVVVQPSDNKSVIGGEFTAYNTVPRNRITRVNTDGSLDTTFNPGSGADQFISVVAIDSSSRILAAGGFTSYNGTQRNRIARIPTTGGLDTTFNPGLGANGTIWALALQSDGKMIVGGEFTTFNVSTRHYVARLNTNGVEDVTFDPGSGPNDKVYAV